MSNQPESILRDFITFLKFPDRTIEKLPMGMATFMRLVGVHYLFLILAMIVMSAFSSLVNLDSLEHSIEDLLTNTSPIAFLVTLAVAAPIIEEIIFRFPLKFRRGTLFILLCILTLLVYLISANFLDPKLDLLPADTISDLEGSGFIPNLSGVMVAMIFFILGLLCIFIAGMSTEMLSKTEKLVSRLFPYVFYLTAMFFGYVHFTNFSGDMKWFWIPFLIVPQFMMGLVMGYARLRFGMVSNIMLHAINNLIPGLIMLAAAHFGLEGEL
jgi:uncharacterized membrane protein